MTAIIAALSAPQSKLSDLYACAVDAMTRYNRWLIEQSVLGEADADSVLRAAKQNALNWFGAIFPECLAISDAVASQDAPITASLKALGQLATQLRELPDRSRYWDSVAALVRDLAKPVELIASRAAALSSALDQAGVSMDQDRQRFGEQEAQASMRVRRSTERAVQINGALHAEQHACCPNRKRLTELAQAASSEERIGNSSRHVGHFMTTAVEHVKECATGSAYLQKFWAGMVDQTRLATVSFRDFQRNPEALLQVDFDAAVQRWHALVVEFQCISRKSL